MKYYTLFRVLRWEFASVSVNIRWFLHEYGINLLVFSTLQLAQW